jgi:kynurenine formamidase
MRRLLVAVWLAGVTGVVIAGQDAVPRSPRNAAEFDALFERLSNWGRWGKDDQLGSANLVTAATRKRAVALVKDGLSVSLAHHPITEPAVDNPNPFERSFNPPGAPRPPMTTLVDTYKVSYHGYAHSHLDALCHIQYKDRTYNGYDLADIKTEKGCSKLGIEHLQTGIITRGILMDIPRLKNLQYLEPGTPVYVEDLEAWEKKAGVRVGPGDAILLRTGRWARRDKLGPWNASQGEAGLHASAASWIKARGVAFVGSDCALDVLPSRVEGMPLPVHVLMITALGINLLDNQDLEALGDTAATLRRWEFMLTFAPVPVDGGTGFPLNAMATF